MKKIPSIFIRNPENMKVVSTEKNPVCDWVFAGEGIATQKLDGTCCKVENGKLWKRRMVRQSDRLEGKIPEGFVEEDFDPHTNKYFGWLPVGQDDPSDKYHVQAYKENLPDGTYELCGPAINGNQDNFDSHILIPHAHTLVFDDCPRDYDLLKTWFVGKDIEGIVFHHPDGRMAKIKKSDFGLKRKDK